jgi:hypothetical protein
MKFLELKYNINGKELFTVQVRYRFYVDIKQCTRTLAWALNSPRAKAISVFAAGAQMLGDGDLQDQGTGSSPPAGFVGDAWMASRCGQRNMHGTASEHLARKDHGTT